MISALPLTAPSIESHTQMALTNNPTQMDPFNDTDANPQEEEEALSPAYILPNDLWLRIFIYLERPDIDRCAMTCPWWKAIVESHQRYLPKRVIEYVMLSSWRQFSITACSGDVIKVFRFNKFYSQTTLKLSINSPLLMSVETMRCNEENRLFFDFRRVEPLLHNPHDALEPSPPDPLRPGQINGLDLRLRYICPRGRYKIGTPPALFFQKLNSIFKNLSHIENFVFNRFTLTNAFVEKFLCNIDTNVELRHLKMINSKTKYMSPTHMNFLTKFLLKETPDPSRRDAGPGIIRA